jgi:2-succinyl-6-hydroxy-2,4-cyclohexadiene-1-carboxylate synthase
MSDWHALPGPLAAYALGDGERVVFCHGFTQTSASWRPIAARVAALSYESVVVDLPGHGGSADVCADLLRTAELLTTMLGRASYVGYSLGGRLGLHAAVLHPDLVVRLAVIGANPGITDDGERLRRIDGDAALARRVLEIGVPAFLAEWMAQPLFGTHEPDPVDVAERSTNTPAGLASSLRLAGTGSQVSLWSRLSSVSMPTLVMAGERDAKFVEIGRRVAAHVGDGTFAAIADADHAAHLRQPEPVLALLRRWLQITRP